jgi:hypothetical protein
MTREIMVSGKICLVDEQDIEAARAFDTAAKKYFGEYARLNNPIEDLAT